MAQVKTSKGTRAERARQTRNRMLDSARELFIADGYAATTMERIAQEAGVAVQTLYYTFRPRGSCSARSSRPPPRGMTAPLR